MWNNLRLVFYVLLFIGSGAEGIYALWHGKDAGWLSGFVLCGAGDKLFGVESIVESRIAAARTWLESREK